MLDGEHRTLALAGGCESMSRVQIGLSGRLSDWVRKFAQARSLGQKFGRIAKLRPADIGLFIPSVTNRSTGKSMGEHTEETAKAWAGLSRAAQDTVALESHRNAVAAWDRGFFDDLVIPIGNVRRDTIPRANTSLEQLARLSPAFDRTSGLGSITAGNASPLTDGAAGIWVASDAGLTKLPSDTPRARLVDWEIASIDLWNEGLLMAPAYAIPRLLARNGLAYRDIAVWEIHEAFAAQVLAHVAALEDPAFLRDRAGVNATFGVVSARPDQSERRHDRTGPPIRRYGRANLKSSGERTRGASGRRTRDRQHLRRRRPRQRRPLGIGGNRGGVAQKRHS